ncbi:hypothetical protein OIU76_013061 [Salix suchowensis]|nr:hypothetical protein OIU76_013061 [Salix suchowensis]
MAAALSTLHLHHQLTFFRKPSFSLLNKSVRSTRITASLEFNITFAPPKPKPKLPANLQTDAVSPSLPPGQHFIPWIVRGEDGNLKLQSNPPARLIHDIADAKTQPKKKKDQARMEAEPKRSKAARRFYNENFRDQAQRLSKVLAAAGVASRRSSEELIFEGKVTVNGSVCNTPQTRVDPGRDAIYVNGNRLPKKLAPKVYLALNKPKGYICSVGIKEIQDYLSHGYLLSDDLMLPQLGLIIVTNDGDFAQQIAHPSSNLSKEYIATINGVVSKRHLFAISEGTVIEGVHCTPDSVELLPQQSDAPRPRLRIVVHEGRNHEVRELVKNAGLEIHSLKRVRIGGFRLPSDLGLGKHAELKQSDLKTLGWKC